MEAIPVAENIETVIEPVVEKIVVQRQKQTITEKQREGLAKARLTKKKKKLMKEIAEDNSSSNSILYLIATLTLSGSGFLLWKQWQKRELTPAPIVQTPVVIQAPIVQAPVADIQMDSVEAFWS